jgi:hypothetical protein
LWSLSIFHIIRAQRAKKAVTVSPGSHGPPAVMSAGVVSVLDPE